MKNKIEIIVLFVIFTLFITLFGLQKIDLHTADLGRHLVNGKILLGGFDNIDKTSVLHQNIFSADYPDFPFINHHFLVGILFYILYISVGFKGLSLFYILCLISSGLIITKAVKNQLNTKIVLLVSIFLSPILASRQEIRPEGISYLFVALYFYILHKITNKELNSKWLFAIPLIAIIWVNTHIYFVFGLFLLFGYFVQNMINKEYDLAKKIFFTGLFATLFSLINPNFIEGLIYPLKIFGNYGYPIVENKSILFLENYGITRLEFLWHKISFLILLISSIYLVKKEGRTIFVEVFNVWFFWIIGFFAIRYIPLFGLSAMVVFSKSTYHLSVLLKEKIDKELYDIISNITVIFITFCVLVGISISSIANFGFGLKKDSLNLYDFIQKNNIKGPIFNNYDIGGYLIFSMFPKERVFVDNRPEAYPTDFFKDIYIPMQQDKTIFNKIDEQKKFNSIIFYKKDLTPWAQQFLNDIILDNRFKKIYEDESSILLIRK